MDFAISRYLVSISELYPISVRQMTIRIGLPRPRCWAPSHAAAEEKNNWNGNAQIGPDRNHAPGGG